MSLSLHSLDIVVAPAVSPQAAGQTRAWHDEPRHAPVIGPYPD